jgi:membrane-associated phospholipid phosphatase
MIVGITLKNQIIILLLTVLVTVFSYLYLDTGIALLVFRLIRRSYLLTQATSDIPDLLLPTVITLTVLSWAAHFFLEHRGIQNQHTSFLRTCGTVLPVAFIAKAILQYVFGRPDPQIWLFYHQPAHFYWFRIDEGYGCFPSGHMTVFTALMMALSHYYSRYRPILLGSLVLLGVALISTDYHFLSDVLAGVLLGMLVTFVVADGQNSSVSRGGLTPEKRLGF